MNDKQKVYLKTWDWYAPGSHKGAYSASYEPPSQRADVRWVMACERKTQSFMENGDQQKYLDKALYTK